MGRLGDRCLGGQVGLPAFPAAKASGMTGPLWRGATDLSTLVDDKLFGHDRQTASRVR